MQRLIERQHSPLQALLQRFPLEVFHHQETQAVLVTDIVDRANVRMIQARNRLGFALESRECDLRSRLRAGP